MSSEADILLKGAKMEARLASMGGSASTQAQSRLVFRAMAESPQRSVGNMKLPTYKKFGLYKLL